MNFSKIFSVAAYVFFSISALAQTFNVSSVEIHARGAWVEHTGVVQIINGQSSVKIEGLPVGLNESKIQVELKSGLHLQKLNYVEIKAMNSNQDELNNLLDSIHMITVRIQMFEALKHTLNEEREFLKANRQIGSSQEVLLVDDLVEMADFLRERNQDLGLEILDVDLDIQILQEELAELNSRLTKFRSSSSFKFSKQGVLHLDLSSDDHSKTSTDVSIRYLTLDASWRPEYEVFFEENEVFVKRKAHISQSTNVSWDAAEITLYSGSPTDELALESFDPWVIDSNAPVASSLAYEDAEYRRGATQSYVDEMTVRGGKSSNFNFASNAKYTFSLDEKIVIDGGNGTSMVELDSFILNGDIRYKAAPAMNSESYATVRCSDWLGNKLMGGEGRIISGNTYLGDFYMNVPSVGDTLVIPLGTDPHVRCSRELVAESSSSSFLAGKKEMVQTWEMTVENSHTDSVQVDLLDNLPVARIKNAGIEITAEASDNGVVDLVGNKVVYSFSLAALEKRTVTLTIRVKYPSKHNLQSF